MPTSASTSTASASARQHLTRCLATEMTRCPPGDNSGAGRHPRAARCATSVSSHSRLEVPQALVSVRRRGRLQRGNRLAVPCPRPSAPPRGPARPRHGTPATAAQARGRADVHRLQGPDDVAGEQLGIARGCARPGALDVEAGASSVGEGPRSGRDGGAWLASAAQQVEARSVEQGAACSSRAAVEQSGWPSCSRQRAVVVADVLCGSAPAATTPGPRFRRESPGVERAQGLAPVHLPRRRRRSRRRCRPGQVDPGDAGRVVVGDLPRMFQLTARAVEAAVVHALPRRVGAARRQRAPTHHGLCRQAGPPPSSAPTRPSSAVHGAGPARRAPGRSCRSSCLRRPCQRTRGPRTTCRSTARTATL